MSKKRKWIFYLAVVIFLVLQITSYWKLQSANEQLEYLTGNVTRLEEQIGSISSNVYNQVEQALKTQGNLLAFYDYEYRTVHKEDYTVDVAFHVIPKEVKQGSVVTIYTAGKQAEMVQSAEDPMMFDAVLPLSLFGELNDTKVIITEENTQKTEMLEIYDSIPEQLLPRLAANQISYSYSSSYKDGVVTCDYNGELEFSMENKSEKTAQNELTDYRFIIEVDGKIVSEKKLNAAEGTVTMDEKVKVKPGQTATFAVTAHDQIGLKYKVILNIQDFDKDGQMKESTEDMEYGQQSITDKEGKVLYTSPY